MSSPALTWLLVKKHNAFVIRRDGATFTTEAGNLTSRHSFTHSGLANLKTIDIAENKGARGGIVLTKTRASRAAARRPATRTSSAVLTRDFRRVAKAVNAACDGYRNDLKGAALARWSRISENQKAARRGGRKLKEKSVRKGKNLA